MNWMPRKNLGFSYPNQHEASANCFFGLFTADANTVSLDKGLFDPEKATTPFD